VLTKFIGAHFEKSEENRFLEAHRPVLEATLAPLESNAAVCP
jgi:hypothetical protein